MRELAIEEINTIAGAECTLNGPGQSAVSVGIAGAVAGMATGTWRCLSSVPLLVGWAEESLVQLGEQQVMPGHVGGITILRISLTSLILFILTLLVNIYFNEEKGLIKPVIQSIISTLIFGGGLFMFSKNKWSNLFYRMINKKILAPIPAGVIDATSLDTDSVQKPERTSSTWGFRATSRAKIASKLSLMG
jgi:hypothetical protein